MDPRKLRARDVMTPDPITVRSDLSLPELGAFLVEQQISGAPVVDAHGLLVGVVSVNDLARAAGLLAGLTTREPGDGFFRPGELHLVVGWNVPVAEDSLEAPFEGEMGDHTVAEIMSSLIYSVAEDTLVSEIARVMVTQRHHRVLVTRDDQLLGIVSSLDLASLLLTEPDGAELRMPRRDSSSASVA